LASAQKLAMARALYNDGTHSIEDICQTLGILRATKIRTNES